MPDQHRAPRAGRPSDGLDGFGQGVGGGGCDRADEGGLDCTQEGAVPGEAALDVAEEEQRHQGQADGREHGLEGGGDEDVGQEGHHAAHHVRHSDRYCAL